MKKEFVLVFLLAFGSLDIYAQSSKLIGTWVSIEERGSGFSERKITYVSITQDKINVYPTSQESNRMAGSYSWKDSDNDGMSIKINDEFVPYLVTDTDLYIYIPYESGFGIDIGWIYLRKCNIVPASNLIGKWISPDLTGDIEITITDKEITYKKGRQTKTIAYQTGDSPPGIILMTVGYVARPYFFIDDKHVIIPNIFRNEAGSDLDSVFLLTKQ